MEAPPVVVPSAVDEIVPEKLINRYVVAERLDCHIETLAKLVKAGRFIPPILLGNRPRWREADVNAWIADQAAAVKPKRRGV